MNKEELAIRKKIISLHGKSKSVREIAYLLDISKSKAAYWIKRYRQTNKLENLPRSGCPSRLKKKQLSQLKEVLLDFPPKRFGGESLGWTTKMAMQYVKDNFNVQYGMRQMQKLFHKFGIKLITPRPEHAKASYAARVVYRMDFKKNSKKNIWVAPSLISTRLPSD